MENEINNDWIGAKEFIAKHLKSMTPSMFKFILMNRNENGAAQFVRKIGSRSLLISPSRFNKWIDQQSGRK